jgi:hypothetical protein
MALATKDALLGASDLTEREVHLPSIDLTVKIRSLPAAYSNEATSKALETTVDQHGEQTARVNTVKLEALQVLHGLVEPRLDSVEEVEQLQQRIGPAWHRLVNEINKISGIDKETEERTKTRFQAGSTGSPRAAEGNGAGAGSGRPDLRVSTGA